MPNRYDRELARRHRKRDGLMLLFCGAATLLVLAGTYLYLLGTRPRAEAPVGGPFTLVSPSGRQVTDRSLHGRYALIYFGYTQCRDVCPATLTSMTLALQSLGTRAEAVVPVFITIDPARDTPAVLGDYVARFGSRLLGLTGTPAEIRQVEAEFHATSVVHPDGAGLDHSSVLYLMDPDGRFVAPIRADQGANGMAADIAGHLS